MHRRFAVDKTTRVIRDKLPQAAKTTEAELEPAYAKVAKQPINRVAAVRQSQSRWYSTRQASNSVRQFSSTAKAGEHVRSSHPSSRTGNAIRQLTSRAPFASTLRPNLTGGALGRTAGGYTNGASRVGGVRYFSHSPTAPAEVVNNVSQAVRAFWLSGKRTRFDGSNPRTGEKRYRSVSELEEKTYQKMHMSNNQASGSYIDFKVTPTITAIGPLSNVPRSQDAETCETLNNESMMNMLSVDFARALKDLAAIMNDLKRLSTLGDLPISLADSTTLRVRFPGCDIDTVEALCRELGIRRGLVYQDPDFDARNGTNMALLFPFAPSKAPSEATYSPDVRPTKRQRREDVVWDGMMSQGRSPGSSHESTTSHLEEFEIVQENPLTSPSGYSSLHSSEHDELAPYFEPEPARNNSVLPASDYEGLEGIYRFLEQCDGARR
jgi:hypothetical protein